LEEPWQRGAELPESTDLLHRVFEAAVAARREYLGTGHSQSVGEWRIVSRRGPAALCAALLAGGLGGVLRVTDDGLSDGIRSAGATEGCSFYLVGLPEHFPDTVLSDLLDSIAAAFET